MRQKILNPEARRAVLQILLETYPDARAELDHSNAFELLIATMLSAQCTDVRVNQVTKTLFIYLPEPEAIFSLDHSRLEEIIKSCGLYQTKAKNIRATCEILVREHQGQVPQSIEGLTALPGVGIKTANVVASNAFGIPAIAVDTHVFRVSNRLGLVQAKDVHQTERDLQKRIPKDQWTKMHHVLIFHGRYHCKARSPQCLTCPVSSYCLDYQGQLQKPMEKEQPKKRIQKGRP